VSSPETKRAPSGSYADKLWRDALRRAVLKRVEGEQNLDRLADSVVRQGLKGDMTAAKEIGDRLDGKATQHNEHTGADGGPVTFRLIWGSRPK
jgi:hypothetical protein